MCIPTTPLRNFGCLNWIYISDFEEYFRLLFIKDDFKEINCFNLLRDWFLLSRYLQIGILRFFYIFLNIEFLLLFYNLIIYFDWFLDFISLFNFFFFSLFATNNFKLLILLFLFHLYLILLASSFISFNFFTYFSSFTSFLFFFDFFLFLFIY